MSVVLHLIKDDTALARATIACQIADGDEVAVALLHGAPASALPAGIRVYRVPEELSWDELLERIFAADSVITW